MSKLSQRNVRMLIWRISRQSSQKMAAPRMGQRLILTPVKQPTEPNLHYHHSLSIQHIRTSCLQENVFIYYKEQAAKFHVI